METTLEQPVTATETSDAQSADTESAAADKGIENGAQPAKAGSKVNKPEVLRKLLQREKDNPNVKYSQKELDILDEHYAGKLQPSDKPKPKPKAEKPEVVADPPETADKDALEHEEETETEVEAPEEEIETPEISAEAQALMKEVGAKDLKDALAKVKELRASTGKWGQDREALRTTKAELEAIRKDGASLWGDLKAGNPKAIEFAEKTFGVKIAGNGQVTPNGQQVPSKAYIDPKLFIDEESANMVNAVIAGFETRIAGVETANKKEQDRIQIAAAQTEGRRSVIDEMVNVAQHLEAVKGIQGLREAIDSWYGGKPDPRMEGFNELFEIAKESGTNLLHALDIKKGRDATRLIAEAEERGRKAAYEHKPNPSLSGLAGGKGEANYKPYTTDQLEAMAEDHTLIPDTWYDKADNLDKTKIPKTAWKYFDLK